MGSPCNIFPTTATSCTERRGKTAGTTEKRDAIAGTGFATVSGGTPRACGLTRGLDLEEALGEIRTRFKVYADSGRRALTAALCIGRMLREIKSGVFAGAPGLANTTWETWCEQTHDTGKLPFGRRQADRYIQLWENRARLGFENEATSLRAGIARVCVGSRPGPTRERWTPLYIARGLGKEAIHASSKGRMRISWSYPTLATTLHPEGAPQQPCEALAIAEPARGSALASRQPPQQYIKNAQQAIHAAARAFTLSLQDPQAAQKLNQLLDELSRPQTPSGNTNVQVEPSGGPYNSLPVAIVDLPTRGTT